MHIRRTILVIDDDPDILSALQLLIERERYRVITACDGIEGLEKILNDTPDLVILDMMLPRQSGFITLEEIKARYGKGLPVLMLTGQSFSTQRQFAEFLGADEYLLKPIQADKLMKAIHRHCPPVLMEAQPVETLEKQPFDPHLLSLYR